MRNPITVKTLGADKPIAMESDMSALKASWHDEIAKGKDIVIGHTPHGNLYRYYDGKYYKGRGDGDDLDPNDVVAYLHGLGPFPDGSSVCLRCRRHSTLGKQCVRSASTGE